MQKARDHPAPLAEGIGISPLVSVWFQVHYPPLTGVLPTVRSRYWFAIGRQRVLSLTGWAPWIRTHFHVLSLTQVPARPSSPAAYRAVTFYGPPFQAVLLEYQRSKCRSYNPTGTSPDGLG